MVRFNCYFIFKHEGDLFSPSLLGGIMKYFRIFFVIVTAVLAYWAATLDVMNNNHWLINAAILTGWIILYEIVERVAKK